MTDIAEGQTYAPTEDGPQTAPAATEPAYDPTYAEQLLGIIMQSHPDVYERAVLIHRVYQLEAENAALRGQ